MSGKAEEKGMRLLHQEEDHFSLIGAELSVKSELAGGRARISGSDSAGTTCCFVESSATPYYL